MVLSLKAPILSMPQMFDSMPLLRLARKSGFLDIVRRGIIGTSLFGDVSSLKIYVESRLVKEDYIFSCLPFLPQGSKPGKLSLETKKILLEKIQNNGKSSSRYSKDLKNYEHYLDTFVEGVIQLDSALNFPDEVGNYRHNLPSTNAAPLSQQIKKNLAVLKNHNRFRNDLAIKKFDTMVSEIFNKETDINDRTRYYNTLADYKDMDEPEKKKFKELIDVSYNQSLAPLIATKSHMAVRKKNEYADVLIQEEPEEDLSEKYINMKIERVYDEIQKGSIPSCANGKKTIMPDDLNGILETVDSCIKEIPRAGRVDVVNYLYDHYYLSLVKRYDISLKLDEALGEIYVSEMTSENEQEGEEYLREIKDRDGRVEFDVENMEIKKVTVLEGSNLDEDNTKKIAESTF
jgi:hypothetical protein